MAKSDVVKKKAPKVAGAESDVYTAILGLAFITLAGTATWVCLKSLEYFDKIF